MGSSIVKSPIGQSVGRSVGHSTNLPARFSFMSNHPRDSPFFMGGEVGAEAMIKSQTKSGKVSFDLDLGSSFFSSRGIRANGEFFEVTPFFRPLVKKIRLYRGKTRTEFACHILDPLPLDQIVSQKRYLSTPVYSFRRMLILSGSEQQSLPETGREIYGIRFCT